MPNPRIFLSPPAMSGTEIGWVHRAFESNYIAPLGPMVDGLEADICTFTGAKHCAALSSGTAALHLALLILGVGQGDDVVCSSFTFAASANPIVYVGATPVFVDSETDTWNMDPALLEEAIADRKRATGRYPAAIIVVHLYGMPAKIDEIMAVAEKYGIPVIEDAAEAIGASFDGKPLGTFGDFGVFSFNGNKIITTSGGGALVSRNEGFISKARFLATQARDPAPHYEHSMIGYNYRMSNIVAAIGRGQMEALPGFVKRCREINTAYRERLTPLPGVEFLTEPDSRFTSNFWLTTITFDSSRLGPDSEVVRLALEAENIESRPLWKPMHMQPVYQEIHTPMYGGSVCQQLFRDGLCLPSGVSMTEEDIDRVCGTICRAAKEGNA
jgi:dTDP-4-amino-4,6-dideoxygalactose transaminase